MTKYEIASTLSRYLENATHEILGRDSMSFAHVESADNIKQAMNLLVDFFHEAQQSK